MQASCCCSLIAEKKKEESFEKALDFQPMALQDLR